MTSIIPVLFEEQVEKNPDQIALLINQQALSYAELNAKSNQLAHYLREMNVTNKTLVAVCMPPSFDLLISIFGILKAGAGYVPLDLHHPAGRHKFILKDTQAKIIITQSSEAQRFQNNDVHVICIDEIESKLNEYPKKNPVVINQPEDLAYVIYTSGSTGNPKGVMITHSNVKHFIDWFAKALDVTHEDIFDFSSSVAFDFAVPNTLFPLTQGASIAICPEKIKKDAYLYLNYLCDNKVTILKITPSHFRQFKEVVLDEEENPNLSLKYIVFGGETLFSEDIKDWLEHFPKQIMFCEYGPTEATVASSWIKVAADNINQFKSKIPIGKAALNTTLYILDDKLQSLPVGKIGELYIGGNGIAKGYLNNEEKTNKNFIKDIFSRDANARLYKTGDFCRFLKDGNIEFIERKDNQVKIRGYRIQMEEIENCLLSHSEIKEAAVIARALKNDRPDEKQLIAYYVPKNGKQIDVNELRLFLKDHLPQYMIPSFIEPMKKFPLFSNGKLNRKKLPNPVLLVHHDEIIPQNELEALIKNIWERELGIQNINTTDNFFNLGGHSLSAARIITKIRKSTKKDIQIQDLYNAATISELATLITQTKAINEKISKKYNRDFNNSKTAPLSELQLMFWILKLFYPKSSIPNIVGRKRISGKLDINALEQSLASVCKKHPILGNYVNPLVPIQYRQKLGTPHATRIDLTDSSSEQINKELLLSHDYLRNRTWKKGDYLFELRLFEIDAETSELQVAIAHIISDEISSDIFFTNLSSSYLSYLGTNNIKTLPIKASFEEYIIQNNIKIKTDLAKNINFWEAFLQDVSLLSFPEKFTLAGSHHTTYTTISDDNLSRLQSFCTQKQLTITECLCASISISLSPYINNNGKSIPINFVKSTRDNEAYDRAIGLFLRTDIIKIDMLGSPDFIELSKRIRQSIADASHYQSCPIIVKLGCLLKQGWKNRIIGKYLASFFALIYVNIFRHCKLDYRMLKMFILFYLAKDKKDFLVNVNIMNNFVSNNENTKLFGLDLKKLEPHQPDQTVEKNLLNVWFARDSENRANLILSGNLKPAFLNQLGQDIINNCLNNTH